ncbi:MAG TPA: hypothetical protein VGL09_20615 [Methylomirabilota bacterium]
MQRFNDLREHGHMTWTGHEQAWIARPDDVVSALAQQGYEEYKREVTTPRRGLCAAGGVWQGLNTHTGSVASAIWVSRSTPEEALVFIDIDGVPVEG